jgi:hypothetical protein
MDYKNSERLLAMKAIEIGKIALVATAFTLFGVGAVYAATTTVTATIKFVSDLTITQVAAPNFGYVQSATAGTYVLDTTGVVTPSGGGVTEGGPAAAGNYTIKGSASQAITINTSGYTASGASTPSAARCKYGGGSEVACTSVAGAAPTTSGTTLLIGLTVTTTNAGTDGTTNSPSFTLSVVYQ